MKVPIYTKYDYTLSSSDLYTNSECMFWKLSISFTGSYIGTQELPHSSNVKIWTLDIFYVRLAKNLIFRLFCNFSLHIWTWILIHTLWYIFKKRPISLHSFWYLLYRSNSDTKILKIYKSRLIPNFILRRIRFLSNLIIELANAL